MVSFIVLGNYTAQGAATINDAPDRMAGAEKRAEELGGKVKEVYFTMGQYDFVALFEFPSDEAMLTFALQVGREGNVRTTTLRAFPRKETVSMIQGLPSV